MLARTLGRTLDELGQTMSAAEFSDHFHDYQYRPWGDRRSDIHAALISRTIANYAGKMRKKDAELSEFLLNFDRTAETPPVEPDPIEHFKRFG